jgi:hypothetical protein
VSDAFAEPGVSLDIAPEVQAGLAARARGRRLVIDWFATRCCGNVAVGDVVFRWRTPDQPVDPDALRVEALDGLELWIRPELVPLFARARAKVVLRGIGPWRYPSVVVEDGAAWLDFFAACSTRSAATRRTGSRS